MRKQTGRETSPRFHQVENFNRNQYLGVRISPLPKNSWNMHCSCERLPATSLFLHSKVVHVCGQHHNTNQDHSWTGLCPSSLWHICLSHSACLQSCPSKPSSWLALGPDHWHPLAFSYSWPTQLVPTLQTNHPRHWAQPETTMLFA